MAKVLLVSEQYIRENFDVSDSLNSKTITSSIWEAQTFHLASVIGDKLLQQLYTEVSAGTLTTVNKLLLDTYIQPFLSAQTMSILIMKVNHHIGNNGNMKTDGSEDNTLQADYYDRMAGIQLRRLTLYLSKHYSDYHEYLQGFEGIKPHLSASDDTSIWLGDSPKYRYPTDKGWRR